MGRVRESLDGEGEPPAIYAAPGWLFSERLPTVVILTAATVGFGSGLVFGGPRLGYLVGIPLSAVVVLILLWRYAPSLRVRWLAATVIAAYCAGGALLVGDDVLAHVSVGNDGLRYDRGLHLFGAVVTVLLVAEVAHRHRSMGTGRVVLVAVAAGLLVECVELVNALALPNLFSYELGDASLDVIGNFAGIAVGLVAVLWAERRTPATT